MTRLLAAFVHGFVDSKLTPLVILAALLLGGFAVLATPREEEPQIVVPMMDVLVDMPGASVREVEQRVTIPLEKKISEIPGVEYVYSTAMPGASLTIVRFHVGEDEERSIVRLYNKLYANLDGVPPGASPPLVKPRSIDDVPILALTLSSERLDHATLRRIAAELDAEVRAVADVAETTLIGGPRRQLRVTPDPARLAALGLDPVHLLATLDRGNRERRAGSFASGNREQLVNVGGFLGSADDVASLVVATHAGRPVRLRDVARVEDGPEEPRDHVLLVPGAAGARKGLPDARGALPAVTLAVAKRKGTNAVVVAEQVLAKVEALRGKLVPADALVTVTRNYGETAQEKSNELLEHLLIAVVSVAILIALFLGWRAAAVVVIAVPVTLAITLFVYYLYGYTLNRVTLFALIFSIGILVDDPIVGVENLVRHARLPENRGRSRLAVTVDAITEVGSPLILATFAVIFAIVPMAFVRGLMGPYMRPIPVGAATAMLFSMAASFIVTPWAAYRLLSDQGERGGRVGRWLAAMCPWCGRHAEADPHAEGWTMRLYRRVMTPLVRHTSLGLAFLAGMAVLLVAAASLVAVKAVRVKMLPFDNKSELQVVIDMLEGTTLEGTARATRAIADELARVPEVTDVELYVGTASPYNFNGLVRHYFLRRGPSVADIQVNLLPKAERTAQSHDIARRVRPRVEEIARAHGARVKIAEVPPGPPVLQTLVAEVYGPDHDRQIALARQVRDVFRATPGVVDVDWYVEAPQPLHRVTLDKEKAALHGIDTGHVTRLLRAALDGAPAGLLHLPVEKEDVPIVVRVGRADRSSVRDLTALRVASPSGGLVPLGEIVRLELGTEAPSIHRKNGRRVVYVTGDVAGAEESPVYAILALGERLDLLRTPEGDAMLLTASAVVVGSTVILFDPIFQGLAISLMAGEIASTLLSRMAVPILYHLAERRRLPQEDVHAAAREVVQVA